MIDTQKLKKLMDDEGWNSRTLSAVSGVPPSTVWRTVRGKSTPTLETLAKICRALKIRVRDVLGGERPE